MYNGQLYNQAIFMAANNLLIFAHAFGQRYELPIPLGLFVFGGALVVFMSFLLVLPTRIQKQKTESTTDHTTLRSLSAPWTVISFIVLSALVACGLLGSQEVPENILPTLFWLVIWIAVPLSCGIIGDWTERLNPFANIAKVASLGKVRRFILGRDEPLEWPAWLGWWPAAVLFFMVACGELIYNQWATKPAVTAAALLIYFVVSALAGLIYGEMWIKRGEMFSVLFSTWGRLGYFRFGSAGKPGFAGGLQNAFESSPSRVAFTLLLLVSVSFDGLLSTPSWSHFQHRLPHSFAVNTIAYKLLATAIFLALALAIWLLFIGFASAVRQVANHNTSRLATLAGLLPSLLPISFGYLLAHNIEYLVVNGQLLFPLIGNPTGKDSWPIHLAYPFNDSFEPHVHLLPSSFYWYFSVILIIVVHIMAIFLAHRHLGTASKKTNLARRSEYPWVAAMVLYTMLSLWLLAQPLVKEKEAAIIPPSLHLSQSQIVATAPTRKG